MVVFSHVGTIEMAIRIMATNSISERKKRSRKEGKRGAQSLKLMFFRCKRTQARRQLKEIR